MQTHDFLNQVKEAMAKEGIVGKQSARLIEDWNDHLENDTASRMTSGISQQEAYYEACQSLGNPATLARSSADNLFRATWQGRHPWLSTLGICLVLVFVSLLVNTACGAIVIDHWQFLEGQRFLPIAIGLLRVVPWVVGLGWLGWYAWKLPAGWKGFWIVAGCVGMVFPMIQFSVTPANHGPDSGTIQFGLAFSNHWNVLRFVITIGLAGIIWWLRAGYSGLRQLAHIIMLVVVIHSVGCSFPGKRKAMLSAMDVIQNGQVDGISPDAELTYSVLSHHKGPYSDVDRHHFVFQNPDETTGNTTFYFGKSRTSSEWEVFLIQVWSKETDLVWKSNTLD